MNNEKFIIPKYIYEKTVELPGIDGNVRIINYNGKVIYNGEDIARLLGYNDIEKALDYCFYHNTIDLVDNNGIISTEVFINECDIYALIMNAPYSKNKEEFESLTCEDILPQVRTDSKYQNTYFDIINKLEEVGNDVENRIPFRIKGGF